MSKELIDIPNGEGKTVQVPATRHEGKKFEVEAKMQEEGIKAHWERVGRASEAFNAYHKAYGTDFGLEADEVVSAMYLELLNWREFYPSDLGGPAHFDSICRDVWHWFEDNKNKP